MNRIRNKPEFEEFRKKLKKIDEDCALSSNLGTSRKHPLYGELLLFKEKALTYCVEILKIDNETCSEPGWQAMMLLNEISGIGIPEGIRGKYRAMKSFWIQWDRHGRTIKYKRNFNKK